MASNFIPSVKAYKDNEETSRTCLKCGKSFMSKIPKALNRRCPTCDKSGARSPKTSKMMTRSNKGPAED